MENIEKLIEDTGACGLFQFLHVVSTHMCRVVAIWGLNMMAFGNYDPGWTCTRRQFQFPNTSANTTRSDDPWNNNVTHCNCSYIAECRDIRFNSNGKTRSIVTQWGLVCDNDWISSLMISFQMFGQLIGSTVAGYIGENMGRKVCLYGHTLLFAIANLAAAFSTSWQMFATFRFAIGLTIGGIISSAYIYTMEFLNPKWRGIVGGMPITNSGLAIFSLVVYLERDWQWLLITTATFAFLAMLTSFWISESMRWLTVHGKKDKAKRIVVRIARYNRQPVPNMDIIDIIADQENQENIGKRYSYLDLFRNSDVRIITIKLSLLWFFEVTVYYGLSFSVKALPGDFYENFIILSSSEVPPVLLTGLIVNKLGRVKGGALYFGLSAIACGSAVILSAFSLSSELAIVLLAMTAKGIIAGGRSIVRICTGELTPTSVRSLGYSFHLVVSRIGAIIAPFLIPGQNISLNVALIIQTSLLLLSSLIFLSLPESKDKAMADSIKGDHIIYNEMIGECQGMEQSTQKDRNDNRSVDLETDNESTILGPNTDENAKLLSSYNRPYSK